MTLHRRHLSLPALGLVLSLAAACGGTAQDTASPGATATSSSTGDEGGGGEPVTISHVYGETEIAAEPERIATVSWVNADSLLALDVVPVGMPAVEFGGNENASTDWADAKLEELGAGWDTENAPTTYSEADGVNFDAIAATTPDLIVAAYSGLTEEEYDQLSRIAPTIGPLAPNYTASWDAVLETVGTATGREEKAGAVADDVAGALAAVGAENPVVAESTFIAGNLGLADQSISIYTAEDTRSRFFSSLGMTPAEVVTANTPDESTFFLEWSAERADELDSDVFYTWAAAGDTVEDFAADPLFAQIPAVASGGLVITDDDHETLSISAANALSLPWAIEHIVPSVVEAAETSQATQAAQG